MFATPAIEHYPEDNFVKKASHCEPLGSSYLFVMIRFTYGAWRYLESDGINSTFWYRHWEGLDRSV